MAALLGLSYSRDENEGWKRNMFQLILSPKVEECHVLCQARSVDWSPFCYRYSFTLGLGYIETCGAIRCHLK